MKDSSEIIAAIPSMGRHVVMVDLYLDYTYHHYSIFLDRLMSVRKAAERLIERNPEATVAVVGPYTFHNSTTAACVPPTILLEEELTPHWQLPEYHADYGEDAIVTIDY